MAYHNRQYEGGSLEPVTPARALLENLLDDTDIMFHDRIAALITARDGASQDAPIQNTYNQQIRMLRVMREQALQAYGTAIGRGTYGRI